MVASFPGLLLYKSCAEAATIVLYSHCGKVFAHQKIWQKFAA
jgi:hypothetical protein